MTAAPGPVDAYLQELSRALACLPAERRQEWLREVRSHLEESAAAIGGDPHQSAIDAVARFGAVSEVAPGLLTESLLEQSSRGFRPLRLTQGLAAAYGLGWTAFALVFSTGYLLLVPIAMLTLAKLLNPDAGLWLHPSGNWALSFHGFPGSREVLGWWLPVLGATVCTTGWWALNRTLRWALRNGSRQWRKARDRGRAEVSTS